MNRPDTLPEPAMPGAAPTGRSPRIGAPQNRVDGPAKVTGKARYAAEHSAFGLVHGMVVSSTIARGRIRHIDDTAARAVPGVLAVFTHANRPKLRSFKLFYKDMDAPGGTPFRPLHDAQIHYSGQPVALVVAETFEAARHAATLVRIDYDTEPHDTALDANLHRARKPSRMKLGFTPPPEPRGDADAAFAAAPVKIDAEYYAGMEHHNPMEMHASTVLRDEDGHLTIHDKTQSAQNSRMVVCHVFGLSKDKVTIKNAFVGGAFGSGLRPQYQLLLAVMAALALRRSVRVVLTRQQMFSFGHRPETWQRVRLAARHDGVLTSLMHEAIAETSRLEDYVENVVNWSGQLYKCGNARFDYKVVDLDHYTPLDMRAPGAAHGVHAIEVAMDELAHALRMDPIALRLRNYTEGNPNEGDKPFSSKALRECYEIGAERFGWSRRRMEPRSHRDGHELIGYGMATGTWDAMQAYANARAVLHADGHLVVSSATADIGTGTYTAMSLIAAATLGVPIADVTFVLGDSTLPVAPLEGGSWTVASVGPAVSSVCEKLKKDLFALARKLPGTPFSQARYSDVSFADGMMHLPDGRASLRLGDVLQRAGLRTLEQKSLALPNVLRQRKFARAVHSAVFVEVRVDDALGTVRVTRVVSAIAAGRIISMKTARSQISGAIVWGIGQALHEETMTDHNLGRFVNHNLAEYHVSANADIHDIEVHFVQEEDRIVNPLGAKGVGEIGIVGVAAAIVNAVFNATGRRIRSLPMTLDKVMA